MRKRGTNTTVLVIGPQPESTAVLRMDVELSRNPLSKDEASFLRRLTSEPVYARSHEKDVAARLTLLGLVTRLSFFGRYFLTPLGFLALKCMKRNP